MTPLPNCPATLLRTTPLVILLAGCASAGTPIDHDIDLRVSPAVGAALAPHKPGLPLQAQLTALDSAVAIDHKGNFGRIDTTEERQVLEWRPDGLLAATVVGSFRNPRGDVSDWTVRVSSVCGLVPVLLESSSTSRSESTTAVKSGAAVVPLGVSSRSRMGSRQRLVAFSSSVANVCSPAPGTSFSYLATREEQRRFEGSMLSSNKLHTITDSATCAVNATEQPASSLHPSLIGPYLKVSCTFADAAKQVRQSTFAFLIASGIYVPLVVTLNEYQTNTSRYTALSYR